MSNVHGQPAGSRIALVTGAGRGIGRAVAIRLSEEGFRVALTARSRHELEATAGLCAGETLVAPLDITSSESVDRIFGTVENQWGHVAVLVANAGSATSAPVHHTTDEQWAEMINLNLTAPFRCIRRAVPAMRAAGHGRIVVVASVAAKRGSPYLSAYTASKHGILGVVRSAAGELATTGVTINAVCPGYVDTPMTQNSIAEIAARSGRSPDEARSLLESQQVSGRLVSVAEVAEAVWGCVVDETMNGQGIDVDGAERA